MLEWMDAAARHIMTLAVQESERLSHNYVGNEHVLVALASHGGGAAGHALERRGLDAVALRVELDHLVDAGVLPAAWHSTAEVMRSIGVDLRGASQLGGRVRHRRCEPGR
jgi:ATP-dependent Clp protease ATP-binding subunit ClpA